MATSAQKAWGTSVSFDGVTIGEVMSFNGTRSRNMIDVFSCDSADEAVERLTSGLDEGVWTFTCVYQPGATQNYKRLNSAYLAGLKKTLLISGPTPTGASAPTLSVTAVITSLSVPGFGSARDVKTVEFSFTCSGKVVYTDSAGTRTSSSASASPSASTST